MPILTNLMLASFAIIALLAPSNLSETHYTIMPLDSHNEQEIAQILDIFENSDVQNMTGQSPTSILNQIKNNQIIPHKKTILVYKDTASKIVQGILISELLHDGNNYRTHIATLATHKDFRRKKVASSLLQHVENIARNNKYQTISLCVYHDNYNAKRCYRGHGFHVTDDSDISVTMSKQLNS